MAWADTFAPGSEVHTGWSEAYHENWLAVLYIGMSGIRLWTVHLFVQTQSGWNLVSIGSAAVNANTMHLDGVYIDDAAKLLILQDRTGKKLGSIPVSL